MAYGRVTHLSDGRRCQMLSVPRPSTAYFSFVKELRGAETWDPGQRVKLRVAACCTFRRMGTRDDGT